MSRTSQHIEMHTAALPLRRILLVLGATAALIAPGAASASAGHATRCRTGYHQKITHTLGKRRVLCVKNVPASRTSKPATPTAPVTAAPPAPAVPPAVTPSTPAPPTTTTAPPATTPPTTTTDTTTPSTSPGTQIHAVVSQIDTVTIGATIADEQEKWNFCGDEAYYMNYLYGTVSQFYFAAPGNSWGYPADTCYLNVTGYGWYPFSEAELPAFATLTFPSDVHVPYTQ